MTSPHILIYGLSLRSAWGNGHATTYRALIRGLAQQGCRVTFFERHAPWYDAHVDMPIPDDGRLVVYHDIEDVLAEAETADAIIIGTFVPEGPRLADALLKRAPGRVAFYDIDTPVTLDAIANGERRYLDPDMIPRFSAYFSFTAGPTLDLLERRYGAQRAIALYCGVDTNAYRPIETETRYDLSYLGAYSPDRQPALETMLISPARARPDLRFCVAGAMYPDTIDWPANVTRVEHVAPQDHPLFYAQSRYTLNLTREAMRRLGYSPSVRLFEAAACGSAIVSDRWDGLETALTPGEEILVAETGAGMLDILDDYPAAARRRLQEAARRRAVRDHDGAARARVVLDAFELSARAPLRSSRG